MWSGTVSISNTVTQMVLLAEDGSSPQAVSQPFDVVIPPAPVVTSAASFSAVQGQPFAYLITANHGPTSFNAASLPGNANVDTGSGVITGMVATAGALDFTVSASNAGGTGNLLVTLNVEADTDGDGMPDTWEVAHGLNPSLVDASLDLDLDGQSNLNEFLSETDPDDADSVLRGMHVTHLANDAFVQWESVPGRRYRVRTSPDLVSWELLPGSLTTATGTTSSFLHVDAVNGKRIYYRIETLNGY